MTKLEQKLLKLGYEIENTDWTYKTARKWFEYGWFNILFNKEKYGNNIYYSCVDYIFKFKTQQDIDNLQQAFNQLQADLKELKKYEKLE